jgi:hypothetical protein
MSGAQENGPIKRTIGFNTSAQKGGGRVLVTISSCLGVVRERGEL